MARIHDAVEGYLATRAWPYEDRGNYVVSAVAGESGSWTACFDLREDDEQLLVYSVLPLRVPAERRTAVALFLSRANYGLAIGNFEIDLDDGEVRYKTSIDVEGAVLEEPLIDHLLLANIVTVDRYLRALESVVAGADPAASISSVE